MTFLEALNWMSESEENVAIFDNLKLKMQNGKLFVWSNDVWTVPHINFSYLESRIWSKSEPTPEEVEVVAYLAYSGVLTFAQLGSEQDMALSKTNIWRKVKVRFS